MPMSVSTPSRAAPSETTYCTGSAASCGTVNGNISIEPTATFCSPRMNCVRTPSCSLPSVFSARRVPCVRSTSTLCAAAKSATQPAWSPCSWVTSTALMSLGARPSRARRFSVSRRLRPQSMSTVVVPTRSTDCATRQFPLLPLASEAKRSNLLQLLVEERQDALPGTRLVGDAVLVEHAHLARALARGARLGDLHAVLLRPDLALAREKSREESARVFLELGIGVAHEVDAFGAVAIFHGEADAIEREAHAPPHTVERLRHFELLHAVDALLDLRLAVGAGIRGERASPLVLRAEPHHQPPQVFRLESRIRRPRLPARVAHVAARRIPRGRIDLLHAAVADVD